MVPSRPGRTGGCGGHRHTATTRRRGSGKDILTRVEIPDLHDDPLRQLGEWLDEARRAGQPLAESMCVATADPDGAPSARMVLLRGLDTGLVFFTDYGSAKAADLEANPRAAAVLHWVGPVHRQVRAIGPVARTSAAESDRYWATRPAGSRRSALASHQSEVIASRALLEGRVAELDGVPDDDARLARPGRWGGYRLTPVSVELWEERPNRLHDRLRFRRPGGGGAQDAGPWVVERLSP